MKYMCRKCGGSDPCFIDFGDAPAPEYCPCDGERVVWREVAEPTAPPKLTVEELERRGIKWPEWATCAVVEQYGDAAFCADENVGIISQNGIDRYWDTCGPIIPGKWDYADWKNSKIMRPEKVEKSQLPDWLKVGAWAAVGNFVGKIDWLNRDASECRITCGESRFAKTAEVLPVTWRAWTFEEAPEHIKARHIKTGKNIAFTLCSRGAENEPVYWYGYPSVFSLEKFFDEFEQLSGLPCGVPQVDGADLEG